MTRGERVVTFIEKFCRVPEGALVGQDLKLEPFQKRFILDTYDNPAGTKRALLSIARKNGKSGLVAALILAHLVGPEARQNSQIISGAMSREQASLVFALAAKMVRLNPALSDIVRVIDSRKQLVGLPMNVEFRAIAAEGKTAHGLSPVLAILDEVGQIQGAQSDFIDAITTSQGAHEAPLLIAISTQAASDGDLFSLWIDDAQKSGDPRVVAHVYAAPADAAIDDPDAWRAANPALGIFRNLADVEALAAEAKRMPSAEATFRNLVLNQRVSLHSPFISRNVWQSCAGTPASLEGMECYAGLDLSARTDLTAFALVARDPQGVWHCHVWHWTPSKGLIDRAKRDRMPLDLWATQGHIRTTPGATVDYEIVARDIAEITEGLDVRCIGFDRWRIDVLRAEFERIGLTLPLVEHGQGYKDMSPALDALEAELLNGRLLHGGNPVLTAAASGAVVARDPAGNRKLAKDKTTCRIDGLQALAMAFGAAHKNVEAVRTPEFQMLFL